MDMVGVRVSVAVAEDVEEGERVVHRETVNETVVQEDGVWESEGGLVGDTLFECVVVMENEVLGQEEMLGLMERDWEGDRVRQAVDVRDTELQGVGVWDRVGVDVGQ